MKILTISDHNNDNKLILKLLTYDDANQYISNVIRVTLDMYSEIDITLHEATREDQL